MATIQPLAVLPTSKAFAVRRIEQYPDGSVEFFFTLGTPPLPAQETGSFTFPDIQILKDRVVEMVASFDESLMMNIYMAKVWLNADGSFKALTAPVLTNRTLTVDPSATQPISFTTNV